MKTTRPDIGLERLLVALERELIEISDEEIMAAAHELGIRPGMKGSIALLGITKTVRMTAQGNNPGQQIKNVSGRLGSTRSRRPPKGTHNPQS